MNTSKKKYDTISKFVSKEMGIKEVMKILNLKECQIYRLKRIFINEGKMGLFIKIEVKKILIK